MELRHLRYFVAVAEEGSLTVAAEKRLHTAQPSLSRQMRDLEHELGVTLMVRGARGIELTTAGRVFLIMPVSRSFKAKLPAKRQGGRRNRPKRRSHSASLPATKWNGFLR